MNTTTTMNNLKTLKTLSTKPGIIAAAYRVEPSRTVVLPGKALDDPGTGAWLGTVIDIAVDSAQVAAPVIAEPFGFNPLMHVVREAKIDLGHMGVTALGLSNFYGRIAVPTGTDYKPTVAPMRLDRIVVAIYEPRTPVLKSLRRTLMRALKNSGLSEIKAETVEAETKAEVRHV